MLAKGNIKGSITIAIKNFSIEMKEQNQGVVKKFIKTVYFKGRYKQAVKNKFKPLINHIDDLGDEDLKNIQPLWQKTPLTCPILQLMKW